MLRLGFVALALAVLAPAQAQVMRCESGGAVTYSDRPCPNGERQTQQAAAHPSSGGSLDMQIEVKHYPVYGRSWFQLRESMEENGPNGYHGLAGWNVGLELRMRPDRGLCRIDHVKVTVTGAILMPRWVDEADAPVAMQQQWRFAYDTLKRHEDGHIQHGRELGLLVRERLMGLGAMPCDRLEPAARSEFDRLHENLKTRDQEYDRRTQHGTF
jgi:predicted secreted Zn-dependent protease